MQSAWKYMGHSSCKLLTACRSSFLLLLHCKNPILYMTASVIFHHFSWWKRAFHETSNRFLMCVKVCCKNHITLCPFNLISFLLASQLQNSYWICELWELNSPLMVFLISESDDSFLYTLGQIPSSLRGKVLCLELEPFLDLVQVLNQLGRQKPCLVQSSFCSCTTSAADSIVNCW